MKKDPIQIQIWRCMLSRHLADRMDCGGKAIKLLTERKEEHQKTEKMVNDLIEKLVNASKIIQKYDDWVDCLEIAMDDKRDEIVYRASLIQKANNRFKKRDYKIKKEE